MKPSVNWLTNKFVLSAIAFLVWMSFFDQHNWMALTKKKDELQEVRASLLYLNDEIDRMEQACEGLTKDPAYLERFARETYQMKKDDEDLYIVK